MKQTDFLNQYQQCVKSHVSEFADPLILSKGDKVKLGDLAPETKWKNWIWAENAKSQGGWVPIQIIELSEDKSQGVILEDYSAKELDIEKGEMVSIIKTLNGWSWVRKANNHEEGWVPDEVIGISMS
jgi:hypothetical protein